jgi:hypothetical protein
MTFFGCVMYAIAAAFGYIIVLFVMYTATYVMRAAYLNASHKFLEDFFPRDRQQQGDHYHGQSSRTQEQRASDGEAGGRP